jgi:phosphatidylglycerol:prolipoprotein diacylglycerol transferase
VFVHQLDPIISTVAGVHFWWYGLSYALGFWNLHWFLRRARQRLGLTLADVYSLTLCLAAGVLAGGRLIEVAFDEWPFYREHPELIPALWLGGMATHGLLLGAAIGTAIFAHVWKKPFLQLVDALAIPGAFLMGVGRIGNFIDGQIVGAVTNLPWGVQFPDAEGIRHPVVLYDGAKNLLLIPYLLWVRNTNNKPGATAARFVFWYAFPRIFIDLFRDYPTHRLALGTGQTLNIVMALLGIALIVRSRRRSSQISPADAPPTFADYRPRAWQRLVFVALLALCLLMPSNWTQDVPARYGKRHDGLTHSWMYPRIDSTPRVSK